MIPTRFQRVTVAAFALVAIGSLVTMVVFVAALNHQINNIKTARTDGRAQTCDSFNEVIDPINNIIVTFAMPRAGSTRTPSEQAAVNAQVSKILLPRRVCSQQGIDAYVRHDKGNAYEAPPQAKQLIGVTP